MSVETHKLVGQLQTRIEELTQALANSQDKVKDLTNQLETSQKDNQKILDVSHQLSETVNLQEVYSTLTQNIIATGIDRCVIHRCSNLDAENVPLTGQTVFIADVDQDRISSGQNEHFSIHDYPVLHQAVRDQVSLVINDLEKDDRLSEPEQSYFRRYGTRSLIIIPLIVRRHVVRLVSIEGRQPGNFKKHALNLYQIFCNQATVALENVRQVERTATALAGAQSLYRAGRVLASTSTLQATLEEALIEFLYSLNLDQGGITLITADREYGQLMAYCQNYELQDVERLVFPINEEIPYQRVLLSGQPFVSTDAPNDPQLAGFQSFNPDAFPKSLLEAPLILQGETIGWIGADAVREYRDFSQREIDLARAMADQVAIAIQNHRLLEETKRRADQFRTVAEVGETVSGLIELDEVLNNTVNLIRDRFGFYQVSIFLVDEAKTWAVVRASTGEVGKIMVDRPHRLEVGGQSIVGYVTARARPRIALDVGQDAVHFKNPLLPDTRSEMALPLIARGMVIGALDVQSVEANAFQEEDIETLQIMANQLATAIENARLFEQTQRRLMDQAMLYGIGTKISTTLNLQEATDILVAETAEALSVAECTLAVVEGDQNFCVISDYVRQSSKLPGFQGIQFNLNDTAAKSKILGMQEYVARIDELPDHISGLEIDYLRKHQGTALATVPVLLRNEVIALLTILDDTPSRRFTEDNITLLDSIALQAANAIQNARLFEAARESQTFMKSIIDEIPDAIFIKDREHKWAVVNRAFAEGIIGQPEEKLIGRTDHDYMPPEIANRSWERDKIMFESGEIQENERPNVDPDGKVRTVYSRKIPLTLNSTDGKPDYLIGIIQDVTERKEREAERERLIEETQRNLERTQSLYRLSHALTTSTESQSTMEAVLDEYLHLLNLKQGSIVLINQADEYSQIQTLYVDGQPIASNLNLPLEQDRVTQHLLQHPNPLVIEDMHTHPLTRNNRDMRPAPAAAMLVIPLEIGEQLAGLITAESTERGHTFTPSDIALGEAIADQLGIWLENRQLLAEAQYRSNLLQTAAEVSGVAGSILEEEELITSSVNLIRDKFDFYYVGLFLLDDRKEWAVLRAGTGEAGRMQIEKGHRLKVGSESMIGWSVQNRQARIALDVGEERVHFQNPYLPDTHSEMALPLISRDEVIGALTVQSIERGAFSDEDITVLQTMANQLANALTNARLYKATQSAAQRETIIREISGKIRNSISVDDIMKTTVTELSKVLGSSQGGITLKINESDEGKKQMIEES